MSMLKKIFSPSSGFKPSSSKSLTNNEIIGTPVLNADIWNNIIFPRLEKKTVGALAKVSKWLRKLIYFNDELWKRLLLNPKHSWKKPDKKLVADFEALVPTGYGLWRKLCYNYTVSVLTKSYPTCMMECDQWKKGGGKMPATQRSYKAIPGTQAFAAHMQGDISKLKSAPSERTVKVVLLGGGGIGCKSALCIRFVSGNFLDEYDPTIEDSYRKMYSVDGQDVVFDMLDTAGQEEFSSMRDQWIRGGEGFLLGFAVTSRASYDEIDEGVQQIRRLDGCEGVGAPLRPIVVIGNKIDLIKERQVTNTEAAQHCANLGACCYVDMSVKENQNCNLAFELIAKLIIRHREAAAKWKPPDVTVAFSKSSVANPLSGGATSLLHDLCMSDCSVGRDVSVDLVRKILEASPPSVVNWRNQYGSSPLHLLCMAKSANGIELNRRRAIIRMLLEKGADPLALNLERVTPLGLAKGTEFEMLLLAHLVGRVVWSEKQKKKGNHQWFTKGPVPNITKSESLFRNGKERKGESNAALDALLLSHSAASSSSSQSSAAPSSPLSPKQTVPTKPIPPTPSSPKQITTATPPVKPKPSAETKPPAAKSSAALSSPLPAQAALSTKPSASPSPPPVGNNPSASPSLSSPPPASNKPSAPTAPPSTAPAENTVPPAGYDTFSTLVATSAPMENLIFETLAATGRASPAPAAVSSPVPVSPLPPPSPALATLAATHNSGSGSGSGSGTPPPLSAQSPAASPLPSSASSNSLPGLTSSIGADHLMITSSELTFEKRLGGGSFGEVFMGRYCGSKVAIKRLLLERLEEEHKREFLSEAQVMTRLPHHRIVLLLAYTDPSEPKPCLVMQLMEGGSLYDALYIKKSNQIRCAHIALQIAEGLAFLHTRKPPIAHRDIKSPNVLLDHHGDAKLGDFGLAKIKATSESSLQSRVGSPVWMAPEIIDDAPYSTSADVYSYAIVLFELCARELPWKGKGQTQLFRAVTTGQRPALPVTTPADWKTLIESCWAQEGDKRPKMTDVILLAEKLPTL